ncbi:MAG TPA: DUF1622 domain-containing protein [Coriobacteriia bacterium]|nr:DUF1622 domain-containing protein [Coriobacteriia bacterium]
MLASTLKEVMTQVSHLFEISGVAIIVGGFLFALVRALQMWLTKRPSEAYEMLRRVFGKSILLGLEVLVAADLIRTIAVEPTLQNLYVLGLLVVIRSFLSWSLDVELEGVWPWNKRRQEHMEKTGC